jgi:predicted ester cyclase
MSTHSSLETRNKALVQRWFDEVWNHGRAELIDEMRAADAAATGLGEGTAESHGAAPFKIFYFNLRQTFPDLHLTIEDILAEGDKVAVRIVMEGTHSSPILGLLPPVEKSPSARS